jgi:hypothetical protein
MSTWGYTIAAYAGGAVLYGGYLTVLLCQRRRLDRRCADG